MLVELGCCLVQLRGTRDRQAYEGSRRWTWSRHRGRRLGGVSGIPREGLLKNGRGGYSLAAGVWRGARAGLARAKWRRGRAAKKAEVRDCILTTDAE